MFFTSRPQCQREGFWFTTSFSHKPKTVPGTDGFRAWFDVAHHDYMICACGWAGHLGTHYCEALMEEENVSDGEPADDERSIPFTRPSA
jgi:hypothetical protein